MSKQLRYKIGDKRISEIDVLGYFFDKANTYEDADTKAAYLKAGEKYFDNQNKIKMRQPLYQGIVGIILLLICVVITLIIPNPTQIQSGVIWILLCVGAGISFVLISGFLNIDKGWIKAGGGAAFASLIYFSVPAVMDKDLATSNERLMVFAASSDTTRIDNFRVDYNRYDKQLITWFFAEKMSEYLGEKYAADSIYCFRKSDGKIYSTEQCAELPAVDAIILHHKIIKSFKTPRDAYLHFLSKCDR